jgi:transcriptional regulator with XRE-family HTH domain
MTKAFPAIDLAATGENIVRLRKMRGLTVRDLQNWFGFEEPQAIYKWQKGKSLPTVDNLYALGMLLDVPMEEILVPRKPKLNMVNNGQQDVSCCPPLLPGSFEYGRISIPCHHFLLSPAA